MLRTVGVLAFALLLSGVCSGEAVESRISTPEGERAYLHSPIQNGTSAAPVLVFLHGNELAGPDTLRDYYRQWEPVAKSRGWHVVLPWSESKYSFTSDTGARTIRAILADFSTRAAVDAQRVFLVGHGDSAPAVFYCLSRVPEQWAAGLAIGGDVGKAIESNRLFAGNAAAIPILWVYEEERLHLLQQSINRLKSAGLMLNLQAANEFTVEQAVEWLSPHSGVLRPDRIDYETGSAEFASSYWLRIAEFDANRRNDALDSTRVDPGTGAFLRLGGFGYDPNGKGPGLIVKWLPEKYKGPLQLEDCIVSIGGTMIEDAGHYSEFMEEQKESRDVGIIVLRNGKSQRLETRIVIPKRDETETARVHAEHLEENRELMLVSRGVAVLEVDIPATWSPLKISWNGLDIADEVGPGCWRLVEGTPDKRQRCQVANDSEPRSGKGARKKSDSGER